MAHSTLMLENPVTRVTKAAPIGFSWTTFFFSFIPAMVRGDWKWGLIQLALACITAGGSALVFMFIYNKLYVKDLLAQGSVVSSATGKSVGEIAHDLGVQLPVATKAA